MWLVPLMGAAALTPTLARFVVLCGSVILGLAVLGAVTTLIDTALGGDDSPGLSVPSPSDATGEVVLVLLGIAAGIGMLNVQYATRSRTRSVAAGVAGLAVAFVVASSWSWPLLGEKQSAVPEWARHPSALRLSSDSGTIRSDPPLLSYRPGLTRRVVRARVQVEAMPTDWSALAGLAQAQLQLADGRKVTSVSSYYIAEGQVMGQADARTHGAIRTVLDVDRLLQPTVPPESESQVILALRDDEFEKLGQEVGRYEGRFWIRLIHHEVEAVIPLAPGAFHQHGAYRLVVDGVLQRGEAAAVLAHLSYGSTMFDQRPRPDRTFYLRNRHKRQAIGGYAERLDREMLISRLLPFAYGYSTGPGFTAQALAIRFGQFRRPDEELPQLDDRWMAGAELVIVRSTQVGAVDRVLVIEGFPVPAVASSNRF
jgi:hypothetical protein